MRKIGINQSGVTTSMIVRDHPQYMWYRELIQNAIEAIQNYAAQTKTEHKQYFIDIRTLDIRDLPGLVDYVDDREYTVFKNKLSFLNAGGMSAQQLVQAQQIGCSINKVNSLLGNYGIGVKSAILNWSDIVIISYYQGRAYYCWLGKELNAANNVDFDIVSYVQSSDGAPVLECTDWVERNAIQRGYDLDTDWTEVIVLGTAVNQNTFTHPYGTDAHSRSVSANHIKEHLSKRYARLPNNIKIRLDPTANTNSQGETKILTLYAQAHALAQKNDRLESKPEYEQVVTEDGVCIHYWYDPACGKNYKSSQDNATLQHLQASGWQVAFSAFVWKNEFYSVRQDSDPGWRSTAFRLGIQQDFRRFRIWVELPDHAVHTEGYRTELKNAQQDILDFNSDENLAMIKSHAPEWFNNLIKQTKRQVNTNLNDMLEKMFQDHIEMNRPLIGTETSASAGTARGTRNKNNTTSAVVTDSPKRRKGNTHKNFKRPQFLGPQTPEIVDDLDKQPNDHFAEVFERAGSNDKDVITINCKSNLIEQISQRVFNKLPDPSQEYLDQIKANTKTLLTIKVAFWLMILRDSYVKNEMNTEEFNTHISSNNLQTFLRCHELHIQNEVHKNIAKQQKNDQKQIQDYDREVA